MPISLLLDPVVDLVDLGGESIKLWDDELLPEGLDQQNDVSSHTSEDRGGIPITKPLKHLPTDQRGSPRGDF